MVKDDVLSEYNFNTNNITIIPSLLLHYLISTLDIGQASCLTPDFRYSSISFVTW